MLILVICRPAKDADQAEFRRLMPAEIAALRELKSRRVLAGAWSPGHPGAVRNSPRAHPCVTRCQEFPRLMDYSVTHG